MPAFNTRHPSNPPHTAEEVAPLDAWGHVIVPDNNLAIANNYWHLVMKKPDTIPGPVTDTAPYGTDVAYEPMQMDKLTLPKQNDVVLGPAQACAMNCKEQAKLRETECDKLRSRVIQALKDGHCPSKITGIKKWPCGGGKKKTPPAKKSKKAKK